LGVFLVLRKYALMGDGLAHIAFGGVATGLLFNLTPFFGALLFSLVGSLGILKIKEKTNLHGDSAIGIVSHASLGIGIVILSVANGFNVDILSYLFGSILAIKQSEMIISIALALIVIAIIYFFYNELFSMTFDETASKTFGIKTGILNAALIFLTAFIVVSSMRVVGLMLVSSLIIIPAASALQLKLSFRNTLIASAMIAVTSVILGIYLAYTFDFAVSGTIVLLNALFFIIIQIYNKIKKLSTEKMNKKHI
ncbi:metal ABC transporter permease, partial [Candidatus Woesearchaeota archaeon]|nr:metal ABC transporter permease [Candidatus Woesearchaeota archaeon]